MSHSKDGEVTQVYVRDAEHYWIPALQTHIYHPKNQAIVTIPKFRSEQEMYSCSSKQQSLRFHDAVAVELKEYDNHTLPLQNVDGNGNLRNYKDMVDLPFMHEAAILYNLKLRHANLQPYTRTGDIVIAVNPYQWLTDTLYTDAQRRYYAQKLVWEATQQDKDPRTLLEPHVYEVSALSYKGLYTAGQDQSILVSGESGAGKTETVKICLNHIASVQRGLSMNSSSSSSDGKDNDVVGPIVRSNPLLEAFGNAKTRRNDNSSRFGKYLQLQFDKGKLVGSKCEVYLLEQNRVVRHEPEEERSFHIFYELLASEDAVKARFWDGLIGKTTTDFKYLVGEGDSNGEGHVVHDPHIDGMTDAERFVQTEEALALVHIENDKLRDLMRAICIVLQLGNLGFDASLDGDTDKSRIVTTDQVQLLATLMDVSVQDLTLAFTQRTLVTRNETHQVPLNPIMAKDACDALAKESYRKIFLWLVQSINDATSAELTLQSSTSSGIIGLLDIFGFESFDTNRFEQLCINYANEKLQQKFTEDVFANVQSEYFAEGISIEDITYEDNSEVLNLIEGTTTAGLLDLLNEECKRPKGNDFEFVQKALQQHSNNPSLIPHRFDRISFALKHYAGIVMYNADGFMSKNMDTLPQDLQWCAQKCSNPIIHQAAASSSTTSATSSTTTTRSYGQKSKSSIISAATVWQKYKSQLSHLMTSLRTTESRYIRCIKPNDQKKPLIMDHAAVVEQLRCAGVVAGITITRAVFPNRLPHDQVLARYAYAWDKKQFPSQKTSDMTTEEQRMEDVKALLQSALWAKQEEVVHPDGTKKVIQAFCVGKTKAYFRGGALEWLEANRMKGLHIHAVTIQRVARGYLGRRVKLAIQQRELWEAQAEQRQLEQERLRLEEIKKQQEQHRLELQRKLRIKEKQLEKLKNAILEETKQGQEAVLACQRRLEEAKAAIEEYRDVKMDEARDAMRKAHAEQAQLELKLNQNMKMVKYMRKENAKARKELEQVKAKLETHVETSEKLNTHVRGMRSSISMFGDKAMAEQMKLVRLRDELAGAKVFNKDMKQKIRAQQDKYMDEAKSRLALQQGLAKILTLIQENSTDRNLVEDAVVTALEAEANAKAEMAALEAMESDPFLGQGEGSESESSEKGRDDEEGAAEYRRYLAEQGQDETDSEYDEIYEQEAAGSDSDNDSD